SSRPTAIQQLTTSLKCFIVKTKCVTHKPRAFSRAGVTGRAILIRSKKLREQIKRQLLVRCSLCLRARDATFRHSQQRKDVQWMSHNINERSIVSIASIDGILSCTAHPLAFLISQLAHHFPTLSCSERAFANRSHTTDFLRSSRATSNPCSSSTRSSDQPRFSR